jgi:DNA-binding IclR family transcriptional regulator
VPRIKAKAESDSTSAATSGAQSISRAAKLMRAIAMQGREGARLIDLANQSGLERPTVHRILKGLIAEGLLSQNEETRRYHLGQLIFELGLAAAPQFSFRDLCQPMLLRIAELTGDTVFLTVRSGEDIVCLDRKEGSFPIRTLTLDVGTRRPLGVGAGGMALLLPLPDNEAAAILQANASRIACYGNLTVPLVLNMMRRARRIGYALNDKQVTPGALSIGLPISNPYGPPYAAVSIGAIVDRMSPERQKELVEILRSEIQGCEARLKL